GAAGAPGRGQREVLDARQLLPVGGLRIVLAERNDRWVVERRLLDRVVDAVLVGVGLGLEPGVDQLLQLGILVPADPALRALAADVDVERRKADEERPAIGGED